jgi:RNA polymerase sigma-70 factor (ECF subfamily)
VAHEVASLDDEDEPRPAILAMTADQSPEGNPAEAFVDRLEMEEISQAIAALPLEYRVVTAMYLVDEMAYQEIAAVLEIPVGTVRSRLHRGRRLLQKALWRIAADRGLVRHPN